MKVDTSNSYDNTFINNSLLVSFKQEYLEKVESSIHNILSNISLYINTSESIDLNITQLSIKPNYNLQYVVSFNLIIIIILINLYFKKNI